MNIDYFAQRMSGNAAAVKQMIEGARHKAKDLGFEPIVKIKAFAAGGVDPAYMGLGPVPAIRKVLARTGMGIGDFDMIELNEAFAAQAIGCMRELNIPTDKPNEVGSGISLGHPVGCTGARQVVDMIHQLHRRGGSVGVTSRCVGGGIGSGEVLALP